MQVVAEADVEGGTIRFNVGDPAPLVGDEIVNLSRQFTLVWSNGRAEGARRELRAAGQS